MNLWGIRPFFPSFKNTWMRYTPRCKRVLMITGPFRFSKAIRPQTTLTLGELHFPEILMNPIDRDEWIDGVLSQVILALARNAQLRAALIFKGARILAMHLGDDRKSLDLDSNLAPIESLNGINREDAAAFLQDNIRKAVDQYYETQNPVRFQVDNVKVRVKPSMAHPMGWVGYEVLISLRDSVHLEVKGLPPIPVEVATMEPLGQEAVVELPLEAGVSVKCFALHRIAAEKLRAFLQSLPPYCAKFKRPFRAPRVKDLYDLAQIMRANAIGESKFWDAVSTEFVLACKSRKVDCDGIDSFREAWTDTKEQYESDRSLGRIPLGEAESALVQIVRYLERHNIFPLHFPLPANDKHI